MRWFYKLPLRLRSLLRKSRVEQELSEELRFHLEKLIEEKVARGMKPEQARYAALRELGGVEQIKEECRDMRRLNYIENFIQDLHYGLRMLAKNPGFTAVAILTLALGIGANTAIFSLIDAILVRALPVSHAESLVVLASFSRNGRVGDFGYSDYRMISDGNRTFAGVLAASSPRRIDVGMGAETEVALGKIVSTNYFSVLGVQSLFGRAFNGEDENVQVVVISNHFLAAQLRRLSLCDRETYRSGWPAVHNRRRRAARLSGRDGRRGTGRLGHNEPDAGGPEDRAWLHMALSDGTFEARNSGGAGKRGYDGVIATARGQRVAGRFY